MFAPFSFTFIDNNYSSFWADFTSYFPLFTAAVFFLSCYPSTASVFSPTGLPAVTLPTFRLFKINFYPDLISSTTSVLTGPYCMPSLLLLFFLHLLTYCHCPAHLLVLAHVLKSSEQLHPSSPNARKFINMIYIKLKFSWQPRRLL